MFWSKFLSVWYSGTLQDHIFDVDLNTYADDHTLNRDFNPNIPQEELDTAKILDANVKSTGIWMNQNRLKLNTDKTELIYFGSQRNLNKSSLQHINLDGHDIVKKDCIRLLGTWLQSTMTFEKHCIKKSQIAICNLLLIRNIRKFIDQDTCQTLISSMVMSHLDYCNSVLNGISEKCLNYMQRVQNMSAKIILKKGKYTSVTESFKVLHWLPIRTRIQFKTMCLIWEMPE